MFDIVTDFDGEDNIGINGGGIGIIESLLSLFIGDGNGATFGDDDGGVVVGDDVECMNVVNKNSHHILAAHGK